MLLRTMIIGAAILAAAPAMAQSDDTTTDKTNAASASQSSSAAVTDPTQFAQKAFSSNKFEIESSKLALDQASSDEVKQFAQRMIDDHTSAGEKFKEAAMEENVDVPSEMADEQQQTLDKLKGLSGDAFEQAYIDAQVKGHDKAVELFSGYAENGQDGALKQFAENTLPTLKDHKERIHEIAGD